MPRRVNAPDRIREEPPTRYTSEPAPRTRQASSLRCAFVTQITDLKISRRI